MVQLLGAVRFVTGAGRTVDVPSASQRRVLAILSLASGATLRAEHLAELVDVSVGSLRTTVSRLRSRLGDDVIRTDAVGYRIMCPVDATLFTDLLVARTDVRDALPALERALALWDGEALEEFSHEPWAQAEAARLNELRCVAMEDRAELLIGRGRAGEAVAALGAHVALHSRRDRARALLIQALAADGRQADALLAYQEYRAEIGEATGTEPSALVRSIERRVAAGWSGVGDERSEADPSTTEWSGSPTAFDVPLAGVLARGAPLIGRRRELTWLESELVQSRSGACRTALVRGEAGIGKTTLVAALARAHSGREGVTVAHGRCDDGASVPLQPFRDIVATLVDHAPEGVLQAHCERFGGELTRLAPRLGTRLWTPPPSDGDDATDRYQLFESVADLLRTVATGGVLVLVLEDLHWAEPTALLLLRHLARALVDVPVLIVVTMRDTGSPSTELLAAVADLERGSVRRIVLRGFDDAELADLVVFLTGARDTPAADVVDELRDQTAGNPLYAVQLVRHLLESGQLVVGDGPYLSGSFAATPVPPSLLDVVESRVRALGDGPYQLLLAGSVLGFEFDEEIIIEMVDQSADDCAAALDASVTAGLLNETQEVPGRMRFTHALVGRALYAQIGGSRRRMLHERAARLLEKTIEAPPQSTVVELARHWALAGDRPSAQRWALVAGDYALAHLAPIEALAWYEAALDHASARRRPDPERADLLVRCGVAQQHIGDPAARATLLEAGDIARGCGASDVLIRAALASDRGLGRVGAVDAQLLAMIEAAIDVSDPADPATHARLLALYALQLIHTPRHELRQEVARHAVELVDANDDSGLLLQTISALTFALHGPGTLPLRRDLALRAVAAASTVGDPTLSFWASRAAYYAAIESADPDLARDSLDQLRSIATDVGAPRLRWVASICETFEATMEARLDDAERFSEVELELGLEIGEPDAFSMYAGQLFAMRSFAGRYDELLPLVQGLADSSPEMRPFQLAYAITCAAVGRNEDAHRILRKGADEQFSRIPVDYTWMTSVIGYAVLATELQDATAAAQLSPILEPFADEVAFSGATSQGPISAYLGKLASVMGDHTAADAYLHHALGIAQSFGWRYHEATSLVALARSRRRRTGALDEEALEWLDAADFIGAACNLDGVRSQVSAVRHEETGTRSRPA